MYFDISSLPPIYPPSYKQDNTAIWDEKLSLSLGLTFTTMLRSDGINYTIQGNYRPNSENLFGNQKIILFLKCTSQEKQIYSCVLKDFQDFISVYDRYRRYPDLSQLTDSGNLRSYKGAESIASYRCVR